MKVSIIIMWSNSNREPSFEKRINFKTKPFQLLGRNNLQNIRVEAFVDELLPSIFIENVLLKVDGGIKKCEINGK